MRSDEHSDVTIPMLAQLSMPVPSIDRDHRIRARCHAVLARERTQPRSCGRVTVFEVAIMSIAGAYGALVVAEAVRFLSRQ